MLLLIFLMFLPLNTTFGQEKPTVAVLPFIGLPPTEGERYAEQFIQSFASLGSIDPLLRGKDSLKGITSEFLFQTSGLTSSKNKAIIGMGINTKYIVSGSIDQTQGKKLLTVLLFDIETITAKTGVTKVFSSKNLSNNEIDEITDKISSWVILKESNDPLQRCMAQHSGTKDIIVIKQLLQQGGINATDDKGLTPLMYAARNGYTDIVKLLSEQGANLDAQTVKKATALMYAAQDGHLETAKVLLELGARKDIETPEGFSAYGLALGNRHKPTARFIKRFSRKEAR